MKKMMKRFQMLALCFVAIVLVVGCGSEEAAKEESGPVTIDFWHSLSGIHVETLTTMVDAYNASQDKIKVVSTFQGNYDEMSNKLQQAIAAGDGPDMAMIGYGYVEMFYASDVLADISPYLKEDGIEKDDFIDGMMLESYYDDKFVSVPFNRSTPILHVNKTVLDEANLEMPETWDDFEKVTNALVQKDGDKVTRYGSAMQLDSWFPFAMINEYNGRFYNESGDGFGFVDNGIGDQVFTQLKDLQNTGALYFSSNTDAYEDTLQAFLNGKAPIAFLSTGASSAIKDSNPDFEYTTAFLPEGDKRSVPTGGGNIAMLSTSDNTDETWDFLSWILQDEQGAQAFTITSGYLPYTYSMTETDAYKELWAAEPYRKTAFDQLEYAEDTSINDKHPVVLKEFYSAIEAIMYDDENIHDVLINFEKVGEDILN